MKASRLENLALMAAVALLAAIAAHGMWLGTDSVIGAYATSLEGRTPAQIENALRAARAADGAVIAPGQVFSFNAAVGPWTADVGYKPAPVSFEGQLVPAWGGGVCQTSTTLYNAALLAGFEIVERHRHNWPATYVPPGRDAAVAYHAVDLKFRNPYSVPARLSLRQQGDRLVCEIRARMRKPFEVKLSHSIHAVARPSLIVQDDPALPRGMRQIVTPGQTGCTVSVFRSFWIDGREVRREQVSLDTYPPMHRVIRMGTKQH